MKIKITIAICALVAVFFQAKAQPADTLRLSLVEAVNLAVQQNPQLQSTQLEEEINKFKIKEIKSSALPQVTGNGTYTDNFSRASQILPGEIFGQPGVSIPGKIWYPLCNGRHCPVNTKIN